MFSQRVPENKLDNFRTESAKDSVASRNININKWSFEFGAGVSNGTRPYTEGYYTSINNQILNRFTLNCYTVGAKYNFSDIVGAKLDITFDRFINSEEIKSKPFEVAQYRTSVQAVFNLNNFIKPIYYTSRFNLLVHGGFHLAILQPIATDYTQTLSNGDNYGGLVFGISPTIKISKKTYMFFDFSSFNNYGQNLTWNGKHSKGNSNTSGHMYAITMGLSFTVNN